MLDGKKLLKRFRFFWKVGKRLQAVETENAELWEKLDKYEKDTHDKIRLLAVRIDNLSNQVQEKKPGAKHKSRRISG